MSGVALLSGGPGDDGKSISLPGVGMMLLSALCNSLYIVGIQTARIPNMSGLVMTFYVMLFSALLSLINALGTGTFQILTSWRELGIAVLLAVVTAVLSNLTLILAIQRIGSTMTSALGVMEPLTAVMVGILVFGEPFSPALAGGVALIAASVLLVMLGGQIRTFYVPPPGLGSALITPLLQSRLFPCGCVAKKLTLRYVQCGSRCRKAAYG